MILTIIILFILVVVLGYTTFNLLKKNEKQEDILTGYMAYLNKISDKNYDRQRDTIVNYIESIIKNEDDSSDEESNVNNVKDINIIADSIFDIASTNKFYSELYATLYNELMVIFPLFSNNVNHIVEQYNASIHNIHFVDSNIDFDKFCDNNKSNDKRKALSSFIVNLMKKGVVKVSVVSTIIINLQSFVLQNIDEADMTYVVDEITENLFILITMSIPELKMCETWNIILSNIMACSTLKVKEHLSISSRAIFKYMDILDKVNK